MNIKELKASYKDTLKSMDTEETIDLCFYRPIGYMWAVLCAKLGIKPNAITIASIFIGVAAGVMFYFDDLWLNIVGVLLLVWANSFDSADGQLARMTQQYSRLGRILDGLSGDFWFVAIYLAICFRENCTSVFFMEHQWVIWVIAVAAGLCHAKQSAKAAYRTKVLFDTNQLLQQAKDKNEIVSATANQLIKLLGKDIVFYLTEGETLGEPHIFTVSGDKTDKEITGTKEEAVAEWVLKNNKHAGATTETLSNAKCLYLAVRVNSRVYGVVGIYIGNEPLDAFEKSILLSILGECALSLENEKNAREKEEAAILAKNEQLRANLLRAISHDLRTPLTSISGRDRAGQE